MRRLFWPAVVFLVVACGVDLPDTPGRRCDDDHPCRPGRVCVAGVCEDEGGPGGGGGGGSGGGGGGGGGGSSSQDAGRVLWSQGVHGFTAQDVGTGCFLEVDALRMNKVVSTIRSALDTQDRAAAIAADPATLALGGNGRLRGRFQLPQALALKGSSPWLLLGPASKPVLLLRFTQAGTLEATSAAGTLGPVALTQTLTVGSGFQPNRDYLLDVQWKRGQFRNLSLEGTLVLQGALTEPDGGFEQPTELRLGINGYAGTADAGWTITLSDWQLGEEPETPMSP